jgi:hypothetical protein
VFTQALMIEIKRKEEIKYIFMHRLNNSFPCFMNFKTRGAAEFKDHKTWKTSV